MKSDINLSRKRIKYKFKSLFKRFFLPFFLDIRKPQAAYDSLKVPFPSDMVTGVELVILTWQSAEFGYAPLDQFDASFQFPLEPPIQYTSVSPDAARTVMDAK